MKRRLLNILSAVSLAVLIALVLLWVRSYWAVESVSYRHTTDSSRQHLILAYSGVGTLGAIYYWDVPNGARAADGLTFSRQLPTSRTALEAMKFLVNFRIRTLDGNRESVVVPTWAPMLAAGVLPWIWLVRKRRQRRHLWQGRCAKCGYDLRASKERCPECGTAIRDGRVKTEDGRMNVKYEG